MNIKNIIQNLLSPFKKRSQMSLCIAEERAEILREKYFQFSFRDIDADKDFFLTISNPIDYHYIAYIYNWDDGPEVLSWIINSSICDQGTAKLIFWRAQPSYFTRFETIEEADVNSECYNLIRNIIDNFEKGFYLNQNIYYDPNDDPGAEDTNYIDTKAKWVIPQIMKEVSLGQK